MDKQAAIRRVRIAVSVYFGILTMALCVLWVRSYWRADLLYLEKIRGTCELGTFPGQIVATRFPVRAPIDSFELAYRSYDQNRALTDDYLGFCYFSEKGRVAFSVPFWFLVAFGIAMSYAPVHSQFDLHFSLRTLLIATTLVVIVLGLGVWLVR